ncbi:TPR-like protein [Punctularia strigosozonata HHB-11173 SS5]|uniref:TPR-like protein n=2 Tax=Punctularia strigosozonata (strain HHB-11173) TaxID=741275 RepID=UPI00044184E0|nr:TPR-like protein [Punctularia strigosozonata HHB-11173 SS5]EIN10155.1 TPR-like protein [Punctularia strigosozonata HHB-11173 SS5]
MNAHEEQRGERIDRALESGKTFLSVLEILTDGVIVCEPLNVAVKLSKGLLEAVEKARKNRRDCKDLAHDMFKLMFIVVEVLKGKTDAEIPTRLKLRLKDLTDVLLKVKDGLEQLNLKKNFSFVSLCKALLRRNLVAEEISVYRNQINMCLQRFQFAVTNRFILDQHAGFARLEDMIRNDGRNIDTSPVSSLPFQRFILDQHAGFARLEDMIRNDGRNIDTSPSTAPVLPNLPISSVKPPRYFFGRDDLVNDLVGKLAGTTQHHVALLGTGGIGKTSVAQAVIDHETIKSKHRCSFIRCDPILTAPSLVLAILQGITGSNASQNGDLIAQLESTLRAAGPVILVLDNFESPWDAGGTRGDLGDVLRTLTALPNVQLILTMRGDSPPAKGKVHWLPVSLEPLSSSSARQLFLSVNPDTPEDEHRDLDRLLEQCGGLPLAVNLLANVKGPFACSILLQQWEKRFPSLLKDEHQSPTRLTSLDVSISLSLNSAAMKSVPEAKELLAVICRLPDGIQGGVQQLIDMDLGLEDVVGVLAVILSAALAFSSSDGSIHVLSPIRQYVMAHHVLAKPQSEALVRYYVDLVNEHADKEPGDDGFKRAYDILTPEMGNIIFLFKKELNPNKGNFKAIARAAFKFTAFQYWSRPSTELIDVLLGDWRDDDTGASHADSLTSRAELLMGMNKYLPAQNDFDAALQESTLAGDQAAVARCQQSLGEIHRMRNEHDQAIEKLTRAFEVLSEIGDLLRAAQCQQSLGNIHLMRYEHDRAIEKLTRALEVLSEIGDRLGAAQCQRSLGDIHSYCHEYDQAIEKLTRALEVFSEIGDRLGVAQCQQSLGNIHRMRDEHDQAIEKLTRALEVFSEIGDRLGAAQCQQSLGNIHLMRHEHDRAIEKLTWALEVFSEIGDRLGAVQCQQSLGDIHSFRHEYDQAIEKLTQALAVFSEIGDRLGAAQCQQSLGDIHHMHNEYDQAIEKLTRALEVFSEIGDRLGAAQCQQSLGNIHHMRHEHDRAIEKLTRALEVFSEIGDRLGAAQCQQSLGDIYRINHQYHAARSNINNALQLATDIGDRYEIAWCRISMGLLDRDSQNFTEAVENIEAARSLLEEIGEKGNTEYCSKLLLEMQNTAGP